MGSTLVSFLLMYLIIFASYLSSLTQVSYERLLLDPLPLPPNKYGTHLAFTVLTYTRPIREIVSKCFNCGAPGHAFTDCPHVSTQKNYCTARANCVLATRSKSYQCKQKKVFRCINK